eukprot:TRINITY_DN3222_c0_g1_i1.p1 TRINITY_DN3222_c0_g1~~TRINITY_DN3222_c0_g1_i1.p1  ORF type:complete len:433 (+),score=83.53 TRINITY_DN3222_c0_g1_i1:81-1379(+)
MSFDILIWGASGFTGSLVAEYLARKIDFQGSKDEDDRQLNDLNWAIAGRSSVRLQQVKENIVKINPNASNVAILLGESKDQGSIDNIVKQAKLVIACAGPFDVYSAPVVDACVRFGVHYVDITGESHYIRKLIDKYHETCEDNEIFIVPSCGFDSVPSDLGAMMAANEIKKMNRECAEIDVYFDDMKAGVSGGTIATMFDGFKKDGLLSMTFGTNKLVPRDSPKSKDWKDTVFFGYDSRCGLWYAPFGMSVVNSKTVRRSNALSGYSYGKDMRYYEGLGFKNPIKAAIATVGTSIFLGLALFPPIRFIMQKFMIKPGEGPSKEKQERCHFGAKVIGISKPQGREKAQKVTISVKGRGDPGYKLTAMMVAESALCLLLDYDLRRPRGQRRPKFSAEGRPAGGILTPATAMGPPLVERLGKNGITFAVESSKRE